MNIKIKNTKGFTLIEMLVVLVIIGILSTVAYAFLSQSSARGRDAERLRDVKGTWDIIRMEKNETGVYPEDIESTKAVLDKYNYKPSSGMADVCYFIAASDGPTGDIMDDDFVVATWGETTSTIERGTPGIIVMGTAQGISNLSQASIGSGFSDISGADFACDNAEGFSKVYDAFVGQ